MEKQPAGYCHIVLGLLMIALPSAMVYCQSQIQKGTESALHRAAAAGNLTALQARLNQGISPDVRNAEGRTALLEAVKAGHPQVVSALLAAGAGPSVASPPGRTPLIEAAENGRMQSAELLIKAGADINAVQRGWGSALETAEHTGHLQVAALLRQAGAKTSGKSVGDKVCVRPWGENGYCGTVDEVNKNDFRIHITDLVGCKNGCGAKAECSAGRPVGGVDGLQAGDVITTKSWCLTHTGVQQ